MAREKVTRSQAGRAIFLTGFMAAGKTTVGRLLAEQLHARFVDLDERIMEREGQSIAQIFAQAGEATFRKIETAALRDVLSSAALHKVVVIALGGGTLEKAENRKIIQGGENALVLLDAPVDELYRRCAPTTAIQNSRPLAGDEQDFRRLYSKRRRRYLSAGLRVDTQDKTPKVVATEIALWLQKRRPKSISGRAREKH